MLTREQLPWYDWIPGDWGHITNIAPNAKHQGLGWGGKNIIYVGAGYFSGGYLTAKKNYTLYQALKEVWGWTDKNVTGSTFNYAKMRDAPEKGLLDSGRDSPTLYQYW